MFRSSGLGRVLRYATLLSVSLLVTSVIIVVCSGCNRGGVPPSKVQKTSGFPLVLKDSLGREVKVDREPQRIVSLAPSNTEILFALGLSEKVVGVTKYCDYPPEAKEKEKIGGFSDPNIEKVVSLNPDLVFATTMHEKATKELEKFGIPVMVLHAKTLEGVMENIILAGRATGKLKEAETIVGDMKEKINGVTEKIKGIPPDKRPKVYYEVFSEPIMSAGPNTLIHDLITLAGGVNVAADAQTDYPEYSLEVLVQKDPDVMIAPDLHGTNTATLEKVRLRPGWGNISAVKNGRVYIIEDDLITVPGPRAVEGLRAIAKALYPDRF